MDLLEGWPLLYAAVPATQHQTVHGVRTNFWLWQVDLGGHKTRWLDYFGFTLVNTTSKLGIIFQGILPAVSGHGKTPLCSQ